MYGETNQICPVCYGSINENVRGYIGGLVSVNRVGFFNSLDIAAETAKITKRRVSAEKAQARKARAAANRRAKHEAYTSLGLKRVRGALGGIYYE